MSATNIHREIESLTFRLSTFKQIYEISKGNPLMTIGMPEKIERLEKQISELKEKAKDFKEPKAELLFSGDAVSGSVGIKASFLADILGSFQKTVKISVLSEKNEPIGERGRIKTDEDAELYVTALPTGSFGVELEQLNPTTLFSQEATGDAIHKIAELIDKICSEEKELTEVMAGVPPRMAEEVKVFFKKISDYNSMLTISTGGIKRSYTPELIHSVSQRLTPTWKEEGQVISTTGMLRGLSLNTWKFEVRDTRAKDYKGHISKDLQNLGEDHFIHLFNKKCSVLLKSEVATSNGTKKQRYELISIEEIGEDKAGG